MQKQRIVAYDNAKFFLIFLVVWGHIVENFYSMELASSKMIFMGIYFFHMPAFIFLSGLMRKRDAKINWKSCLSFFILGYLYKFMNTIVIGLGTGKWSINWLDEDGIPWFMFAMAVWPMMAYLCRKVNPIINMILWVALGCLTGLSRVLTENYALVSRIIVYFPFYQLGCYLNGEKLLAFCKKKLVRIGAAVVSIAYVLTIVLKCNAVYKLRHIVTGKNMYNEWAMSHGHVFLRLFCYVGAAVLILSLISLVPNKNLSFISVFGTRTLAVYVWHRNLIRVMIYSGIQLNENVWIGIAISVVMTLILSVKCFSIPINYILKGFYVRKKG